MKNDMIDAIDPVDDDQSSGGLYPYDPEYENLEITESPFSIFEYLRQVKKEKIIIQPDFQRNLVWNQIQKSRFIESIILNFPLPPIYLNETKDNLYIVIDGLQRTTTLNEFYGGEFALKGLQAVPKFNGYYFEKLPDALKSKFEDKKINSYILKPSTPTKVIYDLFNRINTGGTQLTRQEVRNCIFIGKSTRLLKELSETNEFKSAIDFGVSPKRMKDREAVLRYLSFRWFDYEIEYSGDMSDFVEKAMLRINKMDISQISELKEDFIRVMNSAFRIWGNKGFRIPTEKSRGTINIAIYESVCNYLAKQSDDFLKDNSSKIVENYWSLLEDDEYVQSVTRATGNKGKVLYRFKQAYIVLNDVKK